MPCATWESTAVFLYGSLERGCGMVGGVEGSWSRAGVDTTWPALVLPPDLLGCRGLLSPAPGTLPKRVRRWLWAQGRDVGSCSLSLLLAPLAGCKTGGSVRLKVNTIHLSQRLLTSVLILRSRLC